MSEILKLIFVTTVYKLWGARNTMVYDKTKPPPLILAKEIVQLIKARLSSSLKFHKAARKCSSYHIWL